jgi:uncharacterized protein
VPGAILWPMLVLRADPWNPDYGMGFDTGFDEAPLPRVDPFIETDDWSRGWLPVAVDPGTTWFVDGVRRVELRLIVDQDGARAPGLFGSFAVGSVRCDGRATFHDARVGRSLVLGGGMHREAVEVPGSGAGLVFEPCADPRSDPNGPLERLQELMRQAEESLAAHLVLQGAPLVLADGPLRFGDGAAAPVVGVVKRFVRQYLEPEQEGLLGRLGTGERTPAFALIDQEGTVRAFSWYTRIAERRPAWHDHAGLVRCEVRSGVGLDRALAIANLVTAILPGYAGRPADPRAPQNLAPVAGLETWLRHRMGDRAMIRRSLVSWLHEGGV